MTFSGGDSKKGGEGKSKSSDGGAKTTKTCCPEWQVTKKGSSITQDGKKYVWCPRHHSKDGSINGLYMPAPHHHDAWAKAKAEKVEKYKCSKRDKEGGKGRDGDASPNKKASGPCYVIQHTISLRPRLKSCSTRFTRRSRKVRKTRRTGDGL